MNPIRWQTQAATALLADAPLQTQWDRLNAARLELPFLSAAAMCAALQAFGTGQERLAIGTADGQVAAMLLLVNDGALRWRTFQPSQVPLGAWVAAPEHDIDTLSRSLMRGPLGLCLALSITQVDPLMAPRQPDAGDTTHADYIQTAWVSIEGTFDDYWAARGKNLRQNLRKQRNRLAAESTPTLMRMFRAPEDMAPALARYGAMESAGWKASQGTAIEADNAQGGFYIQLFEDAARRGEALIFEYLIGDKPAAMNLCLLRNGVLVVLKTTYDEGLPKTLSPAFLLREEELQHIFAGQEIRRIEYYGKVMDWHTKLTDSQRALYHLTVYRWPLVKSLAQRRRAAGAKQAEAPVVAPENTTAIAP